MTTIFTTQSLQAFFAFPFKDPQWKNKLLIAALMGLGGFLILPSILLYGYCARIIHRITSEEGLPFLPEWDDWEGLLKDGFRLTAVGFIYTLPIMILFTLGYAGMMMPAFLSPFIENMDNPSPAALWIMVSSFAGMGLMGLGMAIGLFAGWILPVPVMHAAATRDFSAAFRFREWWPVFRGNLGGFALAFVFALGLNYLAAFAVQIVSMTIILCIPIYFVWFGVVAYEAVVFSALFAQVYREGRERAGGGDRDQ